MIDVRSFGGADGDIDHWLMLQMSGKNWQYVNKQHMVWCGEI